MTTKTYVPAVFANKDRQIKDLKFEVAFWRAIHDADKKRIKRFKNDIDNDIRFSREVDRIENSVYGGNK